MLQTIYADKIVQLVKRRNMLTIGLVSAVLLNMIQALSVTYLIRNTKVILVPPEIKEELWVRPKEVSEVYLRDLTDYFASLVLNVTPSSALGKTDLILQHVHPKGYGAVKEQLVKDATVIQNKSITQFFVPMNYEINQQQLLVKVTGDLTILVGQEKVNQELATFKIKYILDHGRLLVADFIKEATNA
jgi:conjugal transfer pilus assembly protein TraE